MARQGHVFANADEARVAKIYHKPGYEDVYGNDRGGVEDVPDVGDCWRSGGSRECRYEGGECTPHQTQLTL